MSKMLRVILVLSGALMVCTAGLVAYLYMHQPAIKQYFIGKVNEQVKARISIEEIDLELFRQFPNVSLDLRGVKIADPVSERQSLLEAQHVFIGFNLYDILSGSYHIRLITFDSGTCNIRADRQGHFNTGILKTDSQGGKQESMFVRLSKVQLNQMRISYTNLESDQHYSITAKDLVLAGSFTDTRQDLTCNGSFFAEHIKAGHVNLLKEKEIRLDLAIGADRIKKTFTVKKGLLQVGDLELDLQGTVSEQQAAMFTDIRFQAKRLSIPALLSLLPFKINSLDTYQSTGEIYFKGSVKGPVTRKQQPVIDIDFGIRNGRLSNTSNHLDLDHINCTGHFNNGKNARVSSLQLRKLSFDTKGNAVKSNLSVHNFEAPYIDADLEGDLDAAQLAGMMSNSIVSAEGKMHFNVSLHGKASDFAAKNNWANTKASGSFGIDMQHIRLVGEMQKEVSQLQASLTLQQNDVLIHSFTARVQQSDIAIKGKLMNVIPYLLLDHQTLEADIEYQSDYLDLEHVMLPATTSPESATTKKAALQLPANLVVNAKVKAAKVIFHHFNATDLNGTISWKGKKISVEQVSCKTMNGQIIASGQVENAPDGRFLVTANTTLKSIQVRELFQQCNNFGQNEITDKQLSGILNTTMEVASVWSPGLDCDLDKLYASGDVHITSGELIDYKPIESLSAYVSVNELRHLKFSELNNKIEIRNKTIFIPSMEVKNNALNLSISGTHTFNNYLDYKIRLKLAELLKKKRNAAENEFGETDEQDKGMYLYLTMKGPIDNLKFTYDKASVKNKIRQDIRTEKNTVKEALKKELGIGKDSTIREKQDDNGELEFEKE